MIEKVIFWGIPVWKRNNTKRQAIIDLSMWYSVITAWYAPRFNTNHSKRMSWMWTKITDRAYGERSSTISLSKMLGFCYRYLVHASWLQLHFAKWLSEILKITNAWKVQSFHKITQYSNNLIQLLPSYLFTLLTHVLYTTYIYICYL